MKKLKTLKLIVKLEENSKQEYKILISEEVYKKMS